MGKPRGGAGVEARRHESIEARRETSEERGHRHRRRARVALCGLLGIAILVAVVVVVGVIPTAQKEGTALAAFEVPWQCTPPPQPGYPRPWEAAIQVATYCTANAVNRNLYTKIPLIGWSGVGPDMSMSLYHNSGAILSTLPLTASMGFSLGPGWRVSYSDQLVIAEGMAQITVVHEDGTQDKFVFGGGQYQAPPGVFDVLTHSGSVYQLTHKDQSYREFDDGGSLTKVVDAVGNELRITRASSRINEIIDATGRKLQFNYDGTGKLTTIVDVNTGFGGGSRTWTLTYDGNNRVQRVTDPMGYITDFGYDGYGRITAISDRRNETATQPAEPQHTYCLTYVTNAIYQVYDPHVSNPTCTYAPVSLNQTFATTCPPGAYMPLVKTTYTDRKTSAATWVYESVRENPSTSPNNGPLTAIEDPYQKRQTFVFTGRLLTQYRDALSRGWNYTYDTRGNRLTAIDPLNYDPVTMIGRRHQWTYDIYNNNLTTYRDPGANTWTLYYANSTYPTLLTAITEPPDGQGNPAADTFLDYYLATPPLVCNPQAPTLACKHGLLMKVTAPTGLWTDQKTFVTGFDYDTYGQRSVYQEGQVTPPSYVYTENYGNDARSRTTSNGWTCGASARASSVGGSGSATHNANNQLLTTSCVEVQPSYDEDPPPLPPPPPDIPKLPCTPLGLPGMCGNGAYTWFGNGLPKDQTQNVTVGQCGGGVTYTRTHTTQYDHLRQVDLATLHTTEYAAPDRVFDYTPNLASATMSQVGPDGVQTFVQYDQTNRVSYLRRGPVTAPILEASYSDYDNGLPHIISYGNPTSARTVYTYDSANRVTFIDHQNGAGATLLGLTYTYNHRDLPTIIQESNAAGSLWASTFGYDARGRLITETKIQYPPAGGIVRHDWTYTYDQGGNRLTKTDNPGAPGVKRRVDYTYDLSDPAGYGSKNNRLMRTKEYDTTATEVLLSTTWYFYNCSGNVTRVVTKQAGSTTYNATRLEYAKNEKAVTYVLGESWTWDGVAACAPSTGYAVSYVRGYRYDSGRARYLDREYNPLDLTSYINNWSDYDGDEIYGDFDVNGTTVTNVASYEPGLGTVDPWTASGASNSRYSHSDHLGTLRLTTGSTGAADSLRVFSAFGERVSGPAAPDRYGYAGAWGYQAHGEFPFLHVGARYYDPSSGRFLQRDPIGVAGGINAYNYLEGEPLDAVDPDGLQRGAPTPIRPPGLEHPYPAPDAPGIDSTGFPLTCSPWQDASNAVGSFFGFVQIPPIPRPPPPCSCGKPPFNGHHLHPGPNPAPPPSPRPPPPSSGGWPGFTCFIGTTPVHSADGIMEISALESGALLKAHDTARETNVAARVLTTFSGVSDEFVNIVVASEQVTCTPEHPFWVEGLGWTHARLLRPGDVLRDIEGCPVPIVRSTVFQTQEPVPVYNITVDGAHTFFVGTRGLLVHNKPG